MSKELTINEGNYYLVKRFLLESQKLDWLKVINKIESINIGRDK
ncbi:hypothetical protein [Lysinibacillus sphaericus]|nr:hypothetical protein [Lysinibacillus sphaericus]